MSNEIDNEEISELVGYLRNIKDYEITNYQSETSLVNFSWGIIMILAGIADLNASFFAGYSPHFFIWFSAVSFGFILQNIISSQPLINNQGSSDNLRPKVPVISIIIMCVMFLGTLVIATYRIEFVLPYITLILAILNSIPQLKEILDEELTESSKTQFDLHFFMLYILTVVLLIEGYFGSTVQIFQGFTFGVMFGFTSIFRGYNQRKLIMNKINPQVSEEEIDQNSQ